MEPYSTNPAWAGLQPSGMEFGTEAIPVPEILIEDFAWTRALPSLAGFTRRVAAVAGGCEAIVFSSDRAVRRLNARHRGIDKPTNVLTFEDGGGQLILAFGTVRREALREHKRFSHHVAHLLVHGMLHLAGYDHHQAGEAREMEMLETKLLNKLGVPNPWSVR